MTRSPLALLLAACAPAMPEIAPLAPDLSNAPASTWTEVGPILEQRCVACHQEGSSGPFRLDTYELAQPWAAAIAAATAARTMPPFLVRGDGTCGEYADNHWLSDEDLLTLQGWADAGAPEGDGYTLTAPSPPGLQGETLDQQTPEFVPQIVGGEYAEFDEYRCFQVALPDETVFLTGYDVVPGNKAIVHHVIGMPVRPDREGWDGKQLNADLIAALDAEDDRDGWPCFSEAGEGVSIESQVVSWAPGQGPVQLPEGVGLRLEAGTVMIYQVHYNLADPSTIGQSDQTTVRLQLTDAVQREARIELPDGFLGGWSSPGVLQPGEAEQDVYFPLPYWADDDILGVLPHMHERGTALRVDLQRKGEQEGCLMEVPAWDFNWQRMYMFETPVPISRGDRLRVWCRYDTLADTDPVKPGWGTRNEMCLPGLLVAPR
jgi:hypothetical protein